MKSRASGKYRVFLVKWVAAAFVVVCAISQSACTRQEDAELHQAVEAVRYMTSWRFLSKSAFTHAFEEHTPSNFVSYLFSDLGVAEWPIAFDEMEIQQFRSVRIPILPSSYALVPNRPDPTQGPQLVLRGDDVAGVVVIEAYPDPRAPRSAVYTSPLQLKGAIP